MKTMKYLIALMMVAVLATSCNKKLDIATIEAIENTSIESAAEALLGLFHQ